jgi:hypothetical protein
VAGVVEMRRQQLACDFAARLEMGKRLYEIVLDALASGVRPITTRAALMRLFRDAQVLVSPRDLMLVYQVVRLLGGGDYGGLVWSAAKEFYPLVRMNVATEVWNVLAGYELEGPRLFRQAADTNWSRTHTRLAIGGLLGRKEMVNPRTLAAAAVGGGVQMGRTVYTTGQIAKLLKVAPRTVSTWIDTQRLNGYRIPGSQDRRVLHGDLVRFMSDNDMPLALLTDKAPTVLVVGCDPCHPVLAAVEELSLRAAYCRGWFEAGEVFGRENTVVGVLAWWCAEGTRAAAHALSGRAALVAVVPDDMSEAPGFDAWCKENDAHLLAAPTVLSAAQGYLSRGFKPG